MLDSSGVKARARLRDNRYPVAFAPILNITTFETNTHEPFN